MSQKADSPTGIEERKLHAHLVEGLRSALDQDDDSAEETADLWADTLLADAAAARATDLHLDPHGESYRIRFRIDGAMLDVAELDHDDGMRVFNQFRALALLDPVPAFRPEGGRFTYALNETTLDVRVTEAPCIAGDKMAIRLLAPSRILQDISGLGLDSTELEYLHSWLATVGGMLLVAGPTGSGKTTTLYALLHHLKMAANHVVTLEDPVEYEIAGINQIPVSRERGLDFAVGAQAMLRLDPDYLVIGEMTESASARAAVNAAAGGRASMSTLHSRDAADTVTVLRNYGLDDFEVASNLELVVAQRLVRRLCPQCRTQEPIGPQDARWLEFLQQPLPEKVWTAPGCPDCNHLGYHGRVGIFELWRPSDEEYAMILDHCDAHNIRRHLAKTGHKFLLDDGLDKANQGLISLGDLRRLGALGADTALNRPSLTARQSRAPDSAPTPPD